MSAKWTFMVYVAGYNNLSPFATKDLAEMREVGSGEDVKVAVFIKRLEERKAQHLLVGRDGRDEVSEELGDVDSGDPQTMLDFIRWAHQQAPAERYALTIWNHGSGWDVLDLDQLYAQVRGERGDTGVTPRELSVRAASDLGKSVFSSSVKEVLSLGSSGDRAIASDDGTGHSLDTIELNRVLKKAHETVLGKPFDLLGMDACLMSCLEVAFEAEKHATAVVCSEELEPGDGWPYDTILARLSENPDMDGSELGKIVVERYIESYRNRRDQWPVTMCATRTAAVGAFSTALDGLAGALRAAVEGDEVDAGRVYRAQTRSVAFTGELVDLRSFCDNLRAAQVDGTVKQAAEAVLEALNVGGDYVIAESHLGAKVKPCGGVTVYFPTPNQHISDYYKDLRFAKRHGWDGFLRAYQRAFTGA
jgi:hypothetical protein